MKRKKFLVISICLVLALIFIAGCSNKPSTDVEKNTSTSDELNEKPPIKYSVYQYSYIPVENDKVMEAITEKFGVSFDFITTIWGDEYFSKLNTLINSGDTPDVFVHFPDNADFRKFATDGVVLDLKDYMANFHNLNALCMEDTGKYVKIDGNLYGIPRKMAPNTKLGWYIRQDWLDKLGLEVPKDFNDLAMVLKEFVSKDPDGMKNTGLSVKDSWWFNFIYAGFTGMWEWGFEDGKYVSAYMQPEFKQALKYLNNLYENGCIDPDFVLNQEATPINKFVSGKAGVIIFNNDITNYKNIKTSLTANYPEAEVTLIFPPIKGDKGGYTYRLPSPYFGMTCLSSDIESPERMLEVLDFMLDEEGDHLLRYGVEDVHYTIKDGERVRNDEAYEHDNFNNGTIGIHNFSMMAFLDFDWLAENNEDTDMAQYIFDNVEGTGLAPTVSGFSSENYNQVASKMYDVLSKYHLEFITGKLDIEDNWDKYIAEYRAAGYDLIEPEVQVFMEQFK